MKLRIQTAELQDKLGDYCRTGELPEDLPGLTPGRVKHYRRLVYNVIRNTLDSAFPISYAALGEETWDRLVADFFSRTGRSSSPQLWKMPHEFYLFHAENRTSEKVKKPFLHDLLYFEWKEIEVHTMPDRVFPSFTSEGDYLDDVLVVNPEFDLITLEYPVHMFQAEKSVEKKGDYYLLIFREPETGNVHFVNLSVIYTYMLGMIYEKNIPINDFKSTLARMAGIESLKYLDETLRNFVKDLMKRGFILGFRKK